MIPSRQRRAKNRRTQDTENRATEYTEHTEGREIGTTKISKGTKWKQPLSEQIANKLPANKLPVP
jgi:hypothetical protein